MSCVKFHGHRSNIFLWKRKIAKFKFPIAANFVYKIQVNPIYTILKYGIFYDFIDR